MPRVLESPLLSLAAAMMLCTAECRCNVVTDTEASLSISRRVGLFLSMCVESGGQVRRRIGIIVTL